MGMPRRTTTGDPALVRLAALVVLFVVLAVHVIGCSAPSASPVATKSTVGVHVDQGGNSADPLCEPDALSTASAGVRALTPPVPCLDVDATAVLEAAVVVAVVSTPRVLHEAAGSNVGRDTLLRHEVFLS